MPGQHNFEVKRNEAFVGDLVYKASGVPVNLSGYSGYLSLYPVGSETVALAITSEGSGATMTLGTSGQIAWNDTRVSGIDPGSYNYDLLLAPPGGPNFDLLTGIVHIDREYAP